MTRKKTIKPDNSLTYDELLKQVQQLKQVNRNLEAELTETKRNLEEQYCIFENAMENSMTGLWHWDVQFDKNLESFSPGFMKVLGYEPDNSLGFRTSWIDIIHPEDASIILEKFDEHVKSKGKLPFDAEVRVFHKNRYIIDAYFRGKVTHWTASDEPLRLIGACMDISKLKQAERALIATNKEYEELHQAQLLQAEELKRAVDYQKDIIFELERKERKLREVQQLTGVGYFISYFDPEHLIWSPEIYTQFGLDTALPPPVGEAYWKMIHPEDIDKAKRAREQALQEGSVTFEQRIIRSDSTIAYLKCTIKPWQNEQGDTIGVYGGSIDITDIKTAQEEIVKSEILQKTIFNSSLDALFIVDPHTDQIVECNERAVQLFEFDKKEDFIGIEVNTLQRKPFTPQQINEVKEEQRQNKNWSSEIEYVTKKGIQFWGNIGVSWLDISVERMALVRITDITERIKFRELLTKTQAIATIGGWEYDLQTKKVTWTDEMYHLYELPVGTVMTMEQTLNFCAPEHVEQLIRSFKELIKDGGSFEFECEHITAQHTRIWVRVIARAHRESDRTIKLSGTLQNIDDQKRQELLLRSKQIELRAFVEAAPAAIAMLDQDMCYIAASEKWYEDYDLLDQKILGNCHYDVLPDLYDDWKEIHERCLQGAIEQKEEDKFEKSDGTIQWLKWEIRPWYDSIGEIGGIIIFTENITERKKQEEELILAKKKAEEASQAKAQFLSTMSHEIRTPMNAVIGMTHILLQDNPNPNQIENLQALRFSAENLLSLINDILDFSKIEAGKIELEQAEFSIKELVHGIKKSLSFNAEDKGIKLKVLLDEDIPEVLLGDPTRLSQILINLISNAIKFTEKGSVTLILEVNHKEGDNINLHFGIKDTGIGIPADKIEKIFESFSQADAHTTRKYGGTGLGLAITKRLLELFGSRIQVESTSGMGSHFFFDITFKMSKGRTQRSLNLEHVQVAFESLKEYKVLLVEDNAMNVLVAKRFLDKWELPFEHAENGKVATDFVSQKDYDLILMDLQMPEMDGYEATQQIRASGKQIPIIALTASAMQETQEKILDVGMSDFVTKPFNPNELYQKIRKYLPAKQ